MILKIILFVFVAHGATEQILLKKDSVLQTPLSNDKIVPLIVGGSGAQPGDFPAKISIQYANGSHICGGTLIDERHVLTSASCMTNEWGDVVHPDTYQLMADDIWIGASSSNPNRQIRGASHVFVHPEFNLYTYDHNVAVIRTNESYYRSPTFFPISRISDSPLVNSICHVAGWGRDEYNGAMPFLLMRTTAIVISHAICNSNNSYNGAVRPGMFCAGHMLGWQGTCEGDDGGGLMCGNLLSGIESWRRGCALRNFPSIYTDVAVYNSWIDSTIIWDEGEHEVVPTPTSITPTTTVTTVAPTITTTTPSPGGAAIYVNSKYLLTGCLTIVFFKKVIEP